MLKSKKVEVVSGLKSIFTSNQSLLLVHYHGLTVAQMSEFRVKLHKIGVKLLVTKNSLAKIAVKDTDFVSLEQYLTGPVAMIATSNPIEVSKIFVAFAKENKAAKFVGGYAFGQVMDLKGIKLLSTMPSLDELRAKIVRLLQAPSGSLVSLLSAPGSGVARVINAYSSQNK